MSLNESDPIAVLNGFATASAEAIREIVSEIPAERFRQAVQMIGNARSIAVAGELGASAVAACLGDGLSQIGYRCRQVQALEGGSGRLVSELNPGDLLIAIGVGGEPGPLTDVVAIARSRGVGVLGIGFPPERGAAGEADLALTIRAAGPGSMQPLAPHFVLAQSLLLALSES